MWEVEVVEVVEVVVDVEVVAEAVVAAITCSSSTTKKRSKRDMIAWVRLRLWRRFFVLS